MINKKASEALQNAINQIKQDLKDLESWFPVWEQGENVEGSRKIREVAKRIALSANKIESFVKDDTFS